MTKKKSAAKKHVARTGVTQTHTVYHKDGTVRAKGQMRNGIPCGYWEWFRKDRTKLRSGTFEGAEQAGEWTTYDKNGDVYTVTQMKAKSLKPMKQAKKK